MEKKRFIIPAFILLIFMFLSCAIFSIPLLAEDEELENESLVEEMDIDIEDLDVDEEFTIEDLWEDEEAIMEILEDMEEIRDPFRDFTVYDLWEEDIEDEIPPELRDLDDEELEELLAGVDAPEEIDLEREVDEDEVQVEEEPISPPEFTMSGHARRGGNYVVVVEYESEMKLVSLGEELDGYRLIDWGKREAVFEKEGEQFRLSPGVK